MQSKNAKGFGRGRRISLRKVVEAQQACAPWITEADRQVLRHLVRDFARAEIEPHRGSAAGVVRFHYPLIVPKEPEKCWIEIGGHHFFWKEGEPLVFDDTREHWVKNQTDA